MDFGFGGSMFGHDPFQNDPFFSGNGFGNIDNLMQNM
jgi:hypothetical protein